MDLEKLKAEVIKPEYDGKSDAEVAAILNAKTIELTAPIPNIQVKRHAILNGYWARVVMAAEATNVNLQVRGLAMSTQAWIEDTDASLDTSLPQVQAMVAGLVQSTLMTQVQADSLLALAKSTVSWTQQTLGVPKVGEHHIAEVRNGQ